MAGTRTRGQDDQAIIDLAFRMALARVGSPRMEGTGSRQLPRIETKPPRSSAVLRGPNATPPFEYGASVATVQALDGDTL
jgi:hypothetical protein